MEVINVPLPSFVLEKEFLPLIELVHDFKIKKIKKNETIFRQGSQYDFFCWIINGTVKISIIGEDGNEKILGFHKNSLIGMDLWYKNSFSVVTAMAYTDIELYCIPFEEMKSFIDSHPNLGISLITYV